MVATTDNNKTNIFRTLDWSQPPAHTKDWKSTHKFPDYGNGFTQQDIAGPHRAWLLYCNCVEYARSRFCTHLREVYSDGDDSTEYMWDSGRAEARVVIPASPAWGLFVPLLLEGMANDMAGVHILWDSNLFLGFAPLKTNRHFLRRLLMEWLWALMMDPMHTTLGWKCGSPSHSKGESIFDGVTAEDMEEWDHQTMDRKTLFWALTDAYHMLRVDKCRSCVQADVQLDL